MQFDVDKKIKEFIECAEALTTYDKLENILNVSKDSKKRNIVLGKKIFSIAKQLLNNSPEEFVKLLDNENIAVAEEAAECLYPLYPQKCIRILEEYSLSLKHDLERFRVNMLIEALNAKHTFCINNFKNLYSCDDLSTLNREKQ